MTDLSNNWFDEHFCGQSMMAILRGFGPDKTLELAAAAWDLGIQVIEVPIQTENDLEALRLTVEAGRLRGRPVGAGTVVSGDHVRQAKLLGAAFTVSPGLDREVIDASIRAGMPTLPGVATASEIQQAVGCGLDWVKAFPARELGLGWFTAMRGPFPQLKLVATGGLDASNAQAFLDVGVRVVAVGSALEDPAQLCKLAELPVGHPTQSQGEHAPAVRSQ